MNSHASSPAEAAHPHPDWLRGSRPLVFLKDMLLTREEASSLAQHPGREALAAPVAGPSLATGLGPMLRSRRHAVGEAGLPSSTAQPAEIEFLEASLAGALGLTGALPWAAWAALADGLRPASGETWATLWPGRLAMTPSQVSLSFPGPHHPLSAQAMTALGLGLGEVLGPDSQVMTGRSGQLYLRSRVSLDLRTAHPDLVAGRHLPSFEPEGAGAATWRRASHAVQMRWHGLPDAAGVDSLWIWGAGVLPAVTAPPAQVSTDPAGRTSESAGGSAATPLPHSAPLWLQGLCTALSEQGHRPLVRWLDPALALVDRPALAWWQAMAEALANTPPRGLAGVLATDGGLAGSSTCAPVEASAGWPSGGTDWWERLPAAVRRAWRP